MVQIWTMFFLGAFRGTTILAIHGQEIGMYSKPRFCICLSFTREQLKLDGLQLSLNLCGKYSTHNYTVNWSNQHR